MASRLNLQSQLKVIPSVKAVYFQAPSKERMSYPCIIYRISNVDEKHANNKHYLLTNRYEIQVIDQNPDSEIWKDIMTKFPMCTFDRFFVADNLNHWNLLLYY